MASTPQRPVLVLGAGINGAAVARELVLNAVPVWIVDANDIAFGATSRSTRLIHGGLRYLEHGDFPLVRESLSERSRLRSLAPQFVEPMRIHIPLRRRGGGLVRSAVLFLGGRWSPLRHVLPGSFDSAPQRGLWIVRMGLSLYDRFARDPRFPKHTVQAVGSEPVPRVNAVDYRWLCTYTDAQMRYPERFVVALLEQTRQLANQTGTEFRLLTYHHADLQHDRVRLRRRDTSTIVADIEPAALINATGAWGDRTLEQLHVASEPILGGTKGSHFVCYQRGLREAIGDDGLYAEATDGRLVFVLPFGEGVLVGTTDVRFEDPPERAVASAEELDYLIGMVNELFPGVDLTTDDVELHYSGVRPLPSSRGGSTAAISRGHSIERHQSGSIPVYTLVGGKLTTCRLFAEQVAEQVCGQIGVEWSPRSRELPVSGGENYPPHEQAVATEWQRLAGAFSLTPAQIGAMWALCGSRVEKILSKCLPVETDNLQNTQIPLAFVRWVLKHEWVTTLDDLVERRLMLVYQPGLSVDSLRQLASCLTDEGLLEPSQQEAAVQATCDRLHQHFGKRLSAQTTPRTKHSSPGSPQP
jgi:glycerol-3-phosphate dehydrogenase